MIWVLVVAFAIIVFIPVGILMTGGAVAALLGWRLKETGEEDTNQELIDLS